MLTSLDFTLHSMQSLTDFSWLYIYSRVIIFVLGELASQDCRRPIGQKREQRQRDQLKGFCYLWGERKTEQRSSTSS